ncbi:MAG: hypothetical protein WCR68_02475 [Candidatus Dojkabacteria bacterium]|jgi:hypothetical protein
MASADILPENPWSSHCLANEVEITCQETLNDYSSPPLSTNCVPYENNDDYRLLTYKKDFNENDDRIYMEYKYCGNLSQIENTTVALFFLKKYLVMLFLTLLIELTVLVLLRFISSFKVFGIVVIANIVSVLMLLLLSWYFNTNFILLIIGEIMVYLSEVMIISKLTHSGLTKKVWISILLANLASAIIGTIILYQLYTPFVTWLTNLVL